jgi:hypothetical protein
VDRQTTKTHHVRETWATGFRPKCEYLDLPSLGDDAEVSRNERDGRLVVMAPDKSASAAIRLPGRERDQSLLAGQFVTLDTVHRQLDIRQGRPRRGSLPFPGGQKHLERLRKFLKPKHRDGLIDAWDDSRIKPGELWRGEIEAALDSACLFIMLVSADFGASDFIHRVELPRLLAKHAEGEREAERITSVAVT